jgi:hypothetical protein
LEGTVKRLDWTKAKPIREREEKYEPGTILPNGRRVRNPADSMAARAAAAEQEFLHSRGLTTLLPKKKFRSKKSKGKRA